MTITVNDVSRWDHTINVGTHICNEGRYHVAVVCDGPQGWRMASLRPAKALQIAAGIIWASVVGLLFKK